LVTDEDEVVFGKVLMGIKADLNAADELISFFVLVLQLNSGTRGYEIKFTYNGRSRDLTAQ